MSALLYGSNQVRLTFDGGNFFLAHLQAATQRRFADGGGYFLTGAGWNDDRRQVSSSHWIHPSIPLRFDYDTQDITGERPAPIEISEETVEVLLGAMDRPIGVITGYDAERGILLPFFTAADAEI
jgi:hypothetical protein